LIVKSGNYWKVIKKIDLYNLNYSQSGSQIYGQKVEQQITSAIAYVMSGRIPNVYTITGHNEFSLAQSGIDIEVIAANFNLETLDITTASGIPDDADMLLLIGPKRDFTEYEAGKLEAYLKDGGKLLAAFGYTESKMENLYSVLRIYDLEIIKGLVMERNTSRLLSEFSDNPFVFAPFMKENEITDFIENSQLDPILSASVGFRRTEYEKGNLNFNTILASSDNSWLRIDLTKQNYSLLSSDIAGPVDVAVSINGTDRDTGEDVGARIVVIGSDLAFTPLPGIGVIPGNVKLLIGSLSWLDNNKSTVMVPSKSLFDIPLRIDTRTALIYGGIVTLLIPLIILITALVVYRKRKNL